MALYLIFGHILKHSLNVFVTASNIILYGWITMHLTVVQI